MPPTFISDGVTPGASAANADDPSANSISAKAGVKYLSIASSPYEQRSAYPRRGRDPANRGRYSAVLLPRYSSFLELVKPFRNGSPRGQGATSIRVELTRRLTC